MKNAVTTRAQLGAFQVNLKTGELRKGKRRVVLQEQPFQILLMLVEASGALVTREEIRKKLWPNDTVVEFDHSIRTAINKLRRALEDSGDRPKYVETVARRGYRLLVPVESLESTPGEAPSSDKGPGDEDVNADGLELASAALIGRTVSHYRVLNIIGGGGMGVVYRAEDLKLGRAVALKFLPEELGSDPQALERFSREARAASSLDHPNICPIYEFGEHEGRPFMVMQLLEGQTLRDRLAAAASESMAIPLAELLDIGIQVAGGLQAAHEKGIIHRDIKPANIFITDKGVCKILDFGLVKLLEAPDPSTVLRASFSGAKEGVAEMPSDLSSRAEPPAFGGGVEGSAVVGALENADPSTSCPPGRKNAARKTGGHFAQDDSPKIVEATLTRTGVAMGTAGYMSPEQVRGEKLDARSDLFSFGLVLYEMATGQRAFSGETAAILKDAILNQTPVPIRELNASVPASVEQIIDKAIEKDREHRYQHASEVKADLQRLARRAGRSRWLWAAAVAILLISALSLWMASSGPRPALEPKLTQLTSNFNENPIRAGAISPDNKHLAYVDIQGVHLRDLATGETRNLNSPSDNHRAVRFNDIDWWPDGSALIANDIPPFERQTEGAHSRVWRIPVSGDPPRVIGDDAEYAAVSSDGQLVLFLTHRGALGQREVWQMDSNGGHERLLLRTDENSAVYGAAWLGDDRLAYFSVDKSGAMVQSRPLSGGASTTALAFRDPTHTSRLQSLAMLPNGRTFYVLAEPASNGLYCTLWEARIDPETGKLASEPRKLTSRTRSCITLMNTSADGQRILFLEWSAEESIFVAELTANGATILNPRRITPNEAYYVTAWTHDSKQVIYKHINNGERSIFRQAIAEGTAQPIVSLPRHQLGSVNGTAILNNTYPRSTPDGRFVLYALYDEQSSTPRQKILRVPVSGGEPEFVLAGDLYGPPDCAKSPHDLCVFSERSQDRGQLIFTSLDPFKGPGRQIATFAADTKADYKWGVSPQADRIALVNNQNPTIDLLFLNGRPAQKITIEGQRNFDWLYWAPDGKGFYVSTLGHESSLLLYVDLHGNAHTVWRERGGLGTWAIPSPDGRHIAIQSWTLGTNLWSMENF